jgi:pyruvate dehydrogenase E2 component (dihydrolipoyllysine-residue acetyltransferase)
MPTDVVMPQMGESIAEGTIVRWIKKVGDRVERDEPLFEISTDKVDAEIPSPAAGVVAEIRAAEGATVPVNSVVAVIGTGAAVAGEAAGPSGASAKSPEPLPTASTAAAAPAAPGTAAVGPAPLAAGHVAAGSTSVTREGLARARSSPLVRKMAAMHHLDLTELRGTGIGGRVTKQDVLAYLDRSKRPQSTAGAPGPSTLPGTTVPMSVMRKKIAEHMLLSRKTSAHVHSVFEVNFDRVARARELHNAALPPHETRLAKLTYLPFIIKALGAALRAVPIVNASVDGDNIVYHPDVNVGIAVALDGGLIVPVIRKADEKSLRELSQTILDLATRARSKQLKPDEVSGGTFTVTNPGMLGAQFGLPIINQPQVAILAVGAIEKRVTVIDDAIAIRPMAYLSLGFDHRVIDGAVADQFLSLVKQTLERWEGELDR